MNKAEILQKVSKSEDKFLIANLLDKIELCNKTKKVQFTDFLDLYQLVLLEKVLKSQKVSYKVYGGFEGSAKNKIIIYNANISNEILDKICKEHFIIVRIELPRHLYGEYQHRNYLSAIMKLGIKREKIGEIICDDIGADIITTPEIAKFLNNELILLTRFQKSKICIVDINQIRKVLIKKENIRITTTSLRLDSIVSELLKISRTESNNLIREGRVFINYQNELKNSKMLNENDILVIRGKGKYEFVTIEGTTRKEKTILVFNKYI